MWLGRFQKMQNGLSSHGAAAYVRKGTDVMLAVDLVKMSLSKQIDRAVMLAADSDFVYAVQTAKDAIVSTRLCYSNRHPVSYWMLDAFNERLVITDDLINRCLLPAQIKIVKHNFGNFAKGITFSIVSDHD
jgi:uncharacterized LabA/DUF88 family protein